MSLTDESALINAQRLTRESQQRLAAFMDHAAISMAVKDTAGRYEFCNPRFQALVDAYADGTPVQIVGKTDIQIFPPAVGQRLRERDIEVMRQNAPIQDDQQLDLPSGRHNFLVVHFPLVDEHGTLFAVGTLMTDITGYHLLLADENI